MHTSIAFPELQKSGVAMWLVVITTNVSGETPPAVCALPAPATVLVLATCQRQPLPTTRGRVPSQLYDGRAAELEKNAMFYVSETSQGL
jgi:hypothetical protein